MVALGRLSDLGWGQRLRALLDGPDGPVPDAVFEACVAVLRDWDWDQRPTSVLDALDIDRPLSTAALEPLVELNRSRLEMVLKVLDVDGAVRRVRDAPPRPRRGP
nr:hypothetical protein [Nocardia terpenica]